MSQPLRPAKLIPIDRVLELWELREELFDILSSYYGLEQHITSDEDKRAGILLRKLRVLMED